jgi:Pectate lyase superfamily protein
MLKYSLSVLMICLTLPAWARTWNAKTDWHATGDGQTDDSRAIQRGVSAMGSGDTVVFPAPGNYVVASTVHFQARAIRVKCERGAALVGPNRGTDIFDNLQSYTAIGGSATSGCIFRGGGVQAYGRGSDGGQTLDQALTNLTFTYNTFENMTYGPNNFRSNGGIFIGGGSNHVVIRHNTFSNIMPYDEGYNAAAKTYLEQYEPDGNAARAAIWFYGGSNYSIDHNTFLHNYQDIKGCQGQQFQAENMLIHHNFSDSHHRMFMEINSGGGCGNPTYNAGIANFQVYDNFDLNAGGRRPEANTFGLSAPFSQAKQPGSDVLTSIPMSGVVWYNNLLKGVVNDNEYVGIGIEVGARDMKIYNNTIMAQWPLAGYSFGGTEGGYMQDNFACLTTPSRAKTPYFGDSNGKTTTTYLRNRVSGACPPGLRSLDVALGPVTNAGGTLTAIATVNTVEFGIQGVVFAIDGRYVSAVMGSGPYKLNYGAANLSSGPHTVTATVVDAVGVLAVSARQNATTTGHVGPSGPIAPNVDPAKQDFDIAGNSDDPINGRH